MSSALPAFSRSSDKFSYVNPEIAQPSQHFSLENLMYQRDYPDSLPLLEIWEGIACWKQTPKLKSYLFIILAEVQIMLLQFAKWAGFACLLLAEKEYFYIKNVRKTNTFRTNATQYFYPLPICKKNKSENNFLFINL